MKIRKLHLVALTCIQISICLTSIKVQAQSERPVEQCSSTSGLVLEIIPASLSYKLNDSVDLTITLTNISASKKDIVLDDLYRGLHIIVAGQDGSILSGGPNSDSNHDHQVAKENGQTYDDGLRGLVKGLSHNSGSGIHLSPGQSVTFKKSLQYFQIPIKNLGGYTMNGTASLLLMQSFEPWSSYVVLLTSHPVTFKIEE